MKIIIFGGTSEGRQIAGTFKEQGHDVTVSVAGDTGEEELKRIAGIRVIKGRKDAGEMAGIVKDFDICVDATHPYALDAGKNIKKACLDKGIAYYRLLREKSSEMTDYDRLKVVASAEEAAGEVINTGGNILLTTGVKEIGCFSEVDRERLFVRVLPVRESIEKCEAAGIPHRNIAAMFGPFSRKMNEAIIEQFAISWIVTKDGGRAGGFDEKIEAAKNCRIGIIVIKRPEEEGYSQKELIDAMNSEKICTTHKV